jgi:hypothetical protein
MLAELLEEKRKDDFMAELQRERLPIHHPLPQLCKASVRLGDGSVFSFNSV